MAEHAAGAVSHLSIDWHSITGQAVTETVRRLQARLVKATKVGTWHKVHALPSLLTHADSGKALAVRRVTEHQGTNTPGVDQGMWTDPVSKAMALHHRQKRGSRALPWRRVSLPKANGKKRPLGLPTMQERALHAVYVQALDPIADTHADPNS